MDAAGGSLYAEPQYVKPTSQRSRREQRAAIRIAEGAFGPIPLHVAQQPMIVCGDRNGDGAVVPSGGVVILGDRSAGCLRPAPVAHDVRRCAGEDTGTSKSIAVTKD